MATVTVTLSPEMQSFIDELTASGRYASASDVVRDGLRLLEQVRTAETVKVEALKREIGAGFADLEAGRFGSRTAAVIAADVIRKAERAP